MSWMCLPYELTKKILFHRKERMLEEAVCHLAGIPVRDIDEWKLMELTFAARHMREKNLVAMCDEISICKHIWNTIYTQKKIMF